MGYWTTYQNKQYSDLTNLQKRILDVRASGIYDFDEIANRAGCTTIHAQRTIAQYFRFLPEAQQKVATDGGQNRVSDTEQTIDYIIEDAEMALKLDGHSNYQKGRLLAAKQIRSNI